MKLDLAALQKRSAVAEAATSKKSEPAKETAAAETSEPASFGFPAPAPRRHETTVSVVVPKKARARKAQDGKPKAEKTARKGPARRTVAAKDDA